MKLGIFDSGIGGAAVAAALQDIFPHATIITVNDHKNVPYGDKTPEEIIRLTDQTIQPLLRVGCNVIVIACNTATAIAIETLRTRYPEQKFVGIEPMIKPAATLTKTGVIAVCATPATLASQRYHHLLKRYGTHLSIVEPDCSTWAYMIENNHINRQIIAASIEDICKKQADVIVLGCTHYHWIKHLIAEIAGNRAIILEPSEALGRRIKQLLK